MKFIRKKKKAQGYRGNKAYPGKANGVDFVSPSYLRETIPTDNTIHNKEIGSYAVEIGGTILPARYFRSFFAEISSGNTWAGMLDSLIIGKYEQGEIDLAIHVQPSPSDQELNEIGRRIAGLLSDLSDEKDVRKIDAMRDEIEDLKERQRRIRLNVERSFRVSIQVIVSSTDWRTLEQLCRSIVQRFAGKSIYLRAADGQQLEALQAVLPTGPSTTIQKERFLSLESSNVADLFPFTNGCLPHRTGVVLGTDGLGRPAWLDLWDSDLTNQHCCIIGRSGAGKTFTIMLIAHRSAHIGIKVGFIDWKGEYGDFLKAVGCPYLELHEKSRDRINPYDVDVTELADGTRYVDIEEAANSVQALTFKMISVYDPTVLTGEVKVFIGTTIREQYRDLGITEAEESIYESETVHSKDRFSTVRERKPMPELSGLWKRMSESESEKVRKAAEMLKPFTCLGNMPSYAIFDGQSTVELKNAPLFGFAINRLDSEIMRPIGLFVATRWMMERWAKKNPFVKKMLVIEECQNIFLDEEVGAVWAEGAYREGRSTNTGVVAVTQGLEVFTRSQAGIAAIKNSPVKIIGIQETLDIDAVQGKLALTEGEANFLVYQAKRGDMVVKVNNQSAIVRIDASRHEEMLFCTDPNNPLYAERKQYMREKAKGAG